MTGFESHSPYTELLSRISVLETESRFRNKLHNEIREELTRLDQKVDTLIAISNQQKGATALSKIAGHLMSAGLGAAVAIGGLWQMFTGKP